MDKCVIGKNGGWAYVYRGFYLVSTEREWVQVEILHAIINTTPNYYIPSPPWFENGKWMKECLNGCMEGKWMNWVERYMAEKPPCRELKPGSVSFVVPGPSPPHPLVRVSGYVSVASQR